MDAETVKYVNKRPELDYAVEALIRLYRDAEERDGRGETGVALLIQGPDSPIRHREIGGLVYQLKQH